MSRAVSLLGRFRRLPAERRRLLLEATAYLAIARLLLLLLPFRRLTPLLGEHMKSSPALEDPVTLERAQEIGRAVETAARHVPWTALCLAQAIAAKLTLRRRRIPSTLYLGVRKGDLENIQAHAWVSVGGNIVTGDHQVPRYAVVSRFVTGSSNSDQKA